MNANLSATSRMDEAMMPDSSQRHGLLSSNRSNRFLSVNTGRLTGGNDQATVKDGMLKEGMIAVEKMISLKEGQAMFELEEVRLSEIDEQAEGSQVNIRDLRGKSESIFNTDRMNKSSRGADANQPANNDANFYQACKEAFDAIEIPERIADYKRSSKRQRFKNIVKLMLIVLLLVCLSSVNLALNLADIAAFNRAAQAIKALGDLEAGIVQVESSTLMVINGLTEEWIYRGSDSSCRQSHICSHPG